MLLLKVLKVLAFTLIIGGAVLVFSARYFVERYGLHNNTKVDFENEMTEAEIENYKKTNAMVKLKMLGMLIALPGLIVVLLLFK